MRREDVTPENNAAVVMWQAYGLSQDFNDISVEDWQVLDRELSLGPLPVADRVLTSIYSPENRQALIQWLDQSATGWQPAPIENPAALAELKMTQEDLDADSIIDQAMNAPWKHDDLPPLADWLDRNWVALDALVDASKRPHFYSPSPSLLRNEDAPLVEAWSSIEISRGRDIARMLRLRAMFHLGEGDSAKAWHDLLACHRWARLIAQGPFVVDQLVAIAIEGVACDGDQVILGANALSPEVARRIHQDLLELGPASDLATSFDEGERIYALDSAASYSRKGIGTFYADNFRWTFETGKVEMPTWQIKTLNLISADWNQSLGSVNSFYDEIVAATRLARYEDRRREFDRLAAASYDGELNLRRPFVWTQAILSRHTRSEMLASLVVTAISSSFYGASDAQDRASTTLTLTRIAAALAIYRAKHGQYPDKLDALVPDVRPQLPVDLYHAKPFVYKRDTDGYLLYSTGENGIDDGGSNKILAVLAGRDSDDLDESSVELLKRIPAGADDISLRLPRPPFKLPTPPAFHP